MKKIDGLKNWGNFWKNALKCKDVILGFPFISCSSSSWELVILTRKLVILSFFIFKSLLPHLSHLGSTRSEKMEKNTEKLCFILLSCCVNRLKKQVVISLFLSFVWRYALKMYTLLFNVFLLTLVLIFLKISSRHEFKLYCILNESW